MSLVERYHPLTLLEKVSKPCYSLFAYPLQDNTSFPLRFFFTSKCVSFPAPTRAMINLSRNAQLRFQQETGSVVQLSSGVYKDSVGLEMYLLFNISISFYMILQQLFLQLVIAVGCKVSPFHEISFFSSILKKNYYFFSKGLRNPVAWVLWCLPPTSFCE